MLDEQQQQAVARHQATATHTHSHRQQTHTKQIANLSKFAQTNFVKCPGLEFSCFSTCTTPTPLSPSPHSSYHSLHTKSREIRQQSAMLTVSYSLSHNTQDSSAAHAYFSVNSSSCIWPPPLVPLPPPLTSPYSSPRRDVRIVYWSLESIIAQEQRVKGGGVN